MSAQPGESIEALYLKERKKSQYLSISVGIALLAAVGGWYYGYQQHQQAQQVSASPRTFQAFGQDGNRGSNGQPPGRGQFAAGFQDVSRFFTDSGEIDTAAVESLIGNIPAEFSERLIGRMTEAITTAVSDGTITQAQADQLTAKIQEVRNANN